MKRHFIKRPVLANSTGDSLSRYDIVKRETYKMVIDGASFEDVDNYLNRLHRGGVIDDEQFSELINWARPMTSNGDVYCSETSSKVVTGVSFDFIHDGQYDEQAIENALSNAFQQLGLELIGIDFRSVDYSMYPEYDGCIVSQCGADFSWVGDYDQNEVSNVIESTMAGLGYEVAGTDFYTI